MGAMLSQLRYLTVAHASAEPVLNVIHEPWQLSVLWESVDWRTSGFKQNACEPPQTAMIKLRMLLQ